jgi:putative transposase
MEKSDFEEFIRRLKRYKKRYAFSLYAYCLIPNHLHLIGEPKKPQNLAKFMQGLLRSYTAYFNWKLSGNFFLKTNSLI